MTNKGIKKNCNVIRNSLILADMMRLRRYIKAKTRQCIMKRQKLLI